MRAKNKKLRTECSEKPKSIVWPSLAVSTELDKRANEVLKLFQRGFRGIKRADLIRQSVEYYCKQVLAGEIKEVQFLLNIKIQDENGSNGQEEGKLGL